MIKSSKKSLKKPIVIISAFAVIMTGLILASFAATTSNSVFFEAETASKSSPAVSKSDTNAQGSSYLEFNSGSSGGTASWCQKGSGTNGLNDGVGFCKFNMAPFNDINFFPIIAYGMPPSDAARYKDIGINMSITSTNPLTKLPSWASPANESELAMFANNGIYVMGPYDHVKKYPSMMTTSPNSKYYLGAMSVDEPARVNPTPLSSLYNIADELKALNSNKIHGVYFEAHSYFYENFNNDTSSSVVTNTKALSAYKNIDFISYDMFPSQYCGSGLLGSAFGSNCTFNSQARIIDHFQRYSGGNKPTYSVVWASNPVSSNDIKYFDALVWQPIIHGATAVGYFSALAPSSQGSALIVDPTLKAKAKETNTFIQSIAPILNQPGKATASATTNNSAVKMELGGREYQGKSYIFAIADNQSTMGDGPSASATFTVSGKTTGTVKNMRTGQTFPLSGGKFTDTFTSFQVKIYEIL